MNTEKVKKIISISVFAATTLLVALILTMVILFAVRGSLAKKEQVLRNEIERTKQAIENMEEEIEYRKSSDYVEKYWLQYGYIQDNSTKFVPKQ